MRAVRLWWLAQRALYPLYRIGIRRPFGWAHVNWLRAWCATFDA